MKRGCSIRENPWNTHTSEFALDYVCNGKAVGYIQAGELQVARKKRYVVEQIHVADKYRRQGIGTELYKAAAHEACRRRAPLASHSREGAMSVRFWEKQVEKGRAEIISARGGWQVPPFVPGRPYPKGKRGPIFSLRCPAPSSLSGRRR